MKIKSKSTYHKSENTFRFLTFAERLANVNVDVIHRIDRTGSYEEEVDTYFSEGLTKWRDLNLTEHFSNFLKEVTNKSQSFNLLVFHQSSIVESLKSHLSIKNNLACEPLLDLVVQLARDLQMDFYPHFPDFFVLITNILETRDTEVLEWAFTCLSYLYKYLWRLMVKDMPTMYSLYSTLLAHKKEHIRRFAAESFSFLLRKVPDLDALLDHMFLDLEVHPGKAEGVGQLLFEMCKGVRNMFHSCAGKALPVALRKLGPSANQTVSLPWDAVRDALDQLAQVAAKYVEKEHFLVLWDSLQTRVMDVLQKMKANEVEGKGSFSENLERLLFILHTLVGYRGGAKITNPDDVCLMVHKLLQTRHLPESCYRLILQIVSSLLLGENISLSNALTQDTVKQVFCRWIEDDLILEFTKEMFTMKRFEQFFLPSFLHYINGMFTSGDSVSRHSALEGLVTLILAKAPPPTDGSMAFETYPLVFAGQNPGKKLAGGTEMSVPELVLSLISLPHDQNQTIDDLSLPWSALVILPHLRPLVPGTVIPSLTALLNRLLLDVESEALGIAGLFVAQQALSTLLSLDGSAQVLSPVPVERVKSIIQKFPSNLSALLLGDLYYTRLSVSGCSEHLSHNALLELHPMLHINLSSNILKIRLLTLRILNHFVAEFKPSEGEDSVEVQSVFAVCCHAELVPASLPNYREKLLHLRKLRHDLVQKSLPLGLPGTFEQIPLRYLIAMLFINFKPLWDPVIELIVSHAKGMDNKVFWKVYHEQLELVAGLAEKELRQCDDEDESGDEDGLETLQEPGCDVIESGDVGVLFLQHLKLTSDPSERTDFTNFRGLLWRAMALFPDRVEPRSRELSPLLLRFIRNEFFPADLLIAPTQDLNKRSSPAAMETSTAGEEEQDTEEHEEEEARPDRKMPPKRAAAKQLIAHLNVFAKFTNPRYLYLEPDLSKLYTQLLCHQDRFIQRATLECVMTYKDPNVVPYKENLERLLDDKHFKDEIVLFDISEEKAVVDASHRAQLIPLLMRILFGRMRSKTGSKFQGKATTVQRSSIVLRFLAGCQSQELGMFIDLLLEPVCHHGQGPCLAAVEKAIAETDSSAVLPLGRQHSLLNIVNTVISKLGHLIQTQLPKLLQILLCVTASVSTVLNQRDQLKAGCIEPLKNLRRLGVLRIQEFFDGFDSYSFTADELDAVFQAIVWPQICRLPTESTYSPTPLLKLIHVWSKNARYFPLLAKQRASHPECDILLNVFSLLSAKNVSPQTVAMVMDIAESLVTTKDFLVTEVEEAGLSVNDSIFPQQPEGGFISEEDLTQGARLLLPHISTLLEYLGGIVRKSDRLKKKKFRSQVAKELNILSKISRFVSNKDQSSVLINLLLPYLQKARNAQETEIDVLSTVQNLLRQCSKPSTFLKPLSRLFSVIHNKLPRQALTSVFQSLGDLDCGLKYITDTAAKLNAFDSRHLDEVYFDVRLTAFQEAIRRINSMETLDMNYIYSIMHNCFASFEIGDMSLADNATMCLSAILSRLAAVGQGEEYKEIVQYTIMDAVRKGLRSKTETVQQDYTTVLACLVKTFPTRKEFKDLVQLTDYNDPESDFFEHMKHIQIHRRGRALRKLAKRLTEGTVVMTSRSLQNYIMPYAMTALFDEKMLKNEGMTSASVEVIGAVCRRLTWSKYLFYLKHFVHVLQTGQAEQKLAVSLLVTVLEAFHFDHDTLEREMEAAKVRAKEVVSTIVDEEGDEEEEEGDALELDISDTEEAMETEAAHSDIGTGPVQTAELITMETNTSGTVEDICLKTSTTNIGAEPEAVALNKTIPPTKAPVTQSGLPQNKAELEDLIASVHATVQNTVLPRLHKCLTAKVKRDDECKAVKSKDVKEEEVSRVPIAFAMVKLMQTLPTTVMDSFLPGILMKLCVHLRNRFQEVRDVARNTLIKIIETLGVKYLQYLLKEMKSILVKGYQVHVLTFTVYQLLSHLAPTLKPGDLDHCMDMLIDVFNNELFGALADEKEVKGITSKLMEARHSKSMDSYEFLGKYSGKDRVIQLILPMKDILENTANLKTANRAHVVLKRIVSGLLVNQAMDRQAILLLSHGLVTESLPLITNKNKEKKVKPPPDPRLPPPSCLLLLPTPKRGGLKAPVSSRTSMHILVDTGLRLLHLSLKKSTVTSSETAVLEMLDPFVALLLDCLNSMHVQVITEALLAFTFLLRFPLPAVENNSQQITKQLFVLLKDYSKAGAARGENFQLVQNCFKSITILVKNVKSKRITETQLQVLLGYAEEDIYDQSRQATAFGLLKAILSRKLVVPEMEELMKKVAKLAVTGQNSMIRVQCRHIYQKYILDYPLGQKLRSHLDFIVAQLSYEHDSGRESALEMMAFIFQTFPQNILLQHSGLFFVPLALAMVNDDSAHCKKMAALAIKALLRQLDQDHLNTLFTLVNTWLSEDKVSLRRLGAQVCGLFVEVEGKEFSRRLDALLPLIEKEIHPDNYEDIEEEKDEKAADRLLFSYLTLITKLTKDCSLLELSKPQDTLTNILCHTETHLRYPHCWVWLTASQLFGHLFAAHRPDQLIACWRDGASAGGSGTNDTPGPVATTFLTTNLDKKMRELVLSFCYQLQSKYLDTSSGEQVIKNLLFVAKVIYLISPESDVTLAHEVKEDEEMENEGEMGDEEGQNEEEDDKLEADEDKKDDRPPSLLWIIKKMSLMAKREAADTPKIPLKRTCVFKFLGAIAVDLGKDRLGPYLTTIIAPLYRELDSTYADQDPTLKNLSQELIDLLKKQVGLQTFSLAFSAVQKNATQRRAARKKHKAMQAVANVDVAANKKMKKHKNKIEAKKRKIEFLRPAYKAKRQRNSLKDLAMVK
ncbi:hypothetical protein DPEC_G00110300 [Dallia pectoralis]|uniref:Uncharacterized protein n=1 Tax=Dallia pectoralis TaxID=75939 RepID=A0ACC2GT63_DALPE|nr:hypothetical protein DPEC_G00110300 [Dallia pectoralis]